MLIWFVAGVVCWMLWFLTEEIGVYISLFNKEFKFRYGHGSRTWLPCIIKWNRNIKLVCLHFNWDTMDINYVYHRILCTHTFILIEFSAGIFSLLWIKEVNGDWLTWFVMFEDWVVALPELFDCKWELKPHIENGCWWPDNMIKQGI